MAGGKKLLALLAPNAAAFLGPVHAIAAPEATNSRPAESALSSQIAAEHNETSDSGLNFYSALQSHQQWKARLGEYAHGDSDGQLDVGTICRDDRCAPGIWLHRAARMPLAQFGLFKRLLEEQAEFHRQAGEVVRLIQSGAGESACTEPAKGQYARISHKVISTLSELYLAVTLPTGRTH
ncbi:CZB domain-containing protein [Thiomonas sp.]